EQLKQCDLDLVVAGTRSAVLMVESEAKMLPEQAMLGAVTGGHQQMQSASDAIAELASSAGRHAVAADDDPELVQMLAAIKTQFEQAVGDAYRLRDKQARYQALSDISAQVVAALATEETGFTASKVKAALSELESSIVRGRILAGELRIDGRDTKTVRPI